MRHSSLLTRAAVVLALGTSTVGVTGCGWLMVDSPRTAGLQCTQSKFFPYFDILLAGGLTAALVVGGAAGEAPPSLIVPGTFALTGLWGVHKVNQCRNKLESMTPEDWARYNAAVAEQNRIAAENAERTRQILLRAAVIQAAANQAAANQAAANGGNNNGGGNNNNGGNTRPPPPPPSGNKTLTINGTTYTDGPNGALGVRCTTDNNTCPGGYACHLVTATSGMCVPSR